MQHETLQMFIIATLIVIELGTSNLEWKLNMLRHKVMPVFTDYVFCNAVHISLFYSILMYMNIIKKI